jgi:outer membrane receptor protein involved in Fe transport
MSGIINTVTKEGTKQYHGDIKVYSGDYLSDFTSYFTYINHFNPFTNYNFQGSLSGPFPFTSEKLTFFANGRYNYDDGYLYGIRKFTTTGDTGNGAYVPMNWHKRWIAQGNLTYWMFQNFKLNGEFLYSKDNYQDYDHAYKWDPDGNVFKFSNSYNGIFTITHLLTSSTFYTLKGSYFLHDFNEHLYNNPLDPRYLSPDSLNTVNYAFHDVGTNLHRFYRQTKTYLLKGDFTSQVTDNHLVKIGVEAQNYRLDYDDYDLEPKTLPNGDQVEPFQPQIPALNTPNRRTYSVKPFQIAGYIQDKIEFNDVIINIGLRFDYFDPKGKVPVDPTDPNIYLPLRTGLDSLSLAQREPYFFKNTTAKKQFSPRFGIAYPISATGVVHFSYGQFLQIPSFQYLYDRGQFVVPQSGNPSDVYGNPDLKPQSTVMYEIGFRQEFFDNLVVDATGFYRDIRNWITSSPLIETRNLVSYSMYINKDYSNVKGITLTVNKRLSDLWGFDLNYTYQVAEGTNSTPEDAFNAQRDNNAPTLYLTPLNWDQRHLVNASLYLGESDWGASLTARYGTGLPYTPSITQYIADRGITSGLQQNSLRKPAQFTLDLKLNKTFDVAGVNVNAFLTVFNLLDNRVVVKVFDDTGLPDYTTEAQNVGPDPNRPNTVAEYLRYPDHYGAPRNIQFGFDISL